MELKVDKAIIFIASEMQSTLKGKNLLPLGAISFPLE